MSIKQNKNRVEVLYLIYWLVLVVWQNFAGMTGRTTVDTFLKAGLLLIFVGYHLIKAQSVNFTKLIPIFLLLIFLSITFFTRESFSLNGLLTYYYPIIFLFCVFVLGDDFCITKKQLIWFLHGVILIVLYMVIYALIFCTDQFLSAFSISSAYGNELTSFLISNHEYSLYLAFATIGAIICFELNKDLPIKKRWYYLVVIPVFLINIILTFSRTTLLGISIALIVYVFFAKKSSLRSLIITFLVLAVCAVLFIPTIREFFLKIVLKDNNLAGRDDLTGYAIELFRKGSLGQKLFGYGDAKIRELMILKEGHSSVHNGYLQILLSFGLLPLICLAVYLIFDIIYCIMLCKYNRFLGIIFVAIVLFGTTIMITNTTILFSSPIDCFFLTMFVVSLPKLVGNSIKMKNFEG